MLKNMFQILLTKFEIYKKLIINGNVKENIAFFCSILDFSLLFNGNSFTNFVQYISTSFSESVVPNFKYIFG